MVILSQDKTQIINFDNIVYLWIQNPLENDNAEFEIVTETDGISTGIGFYKTEERAKEVLQEIIGKYKKWNKDANNAVTIIPKVYEMPEE